MLDALIVLTCVTSAALPRAMQHDPEVGRKRRSDAGPFPPCSNASFVINILPLKTKIKHRVPCSPSRHCPFELEITFCVRGVMLPPLASALEIDYTALSLSIPERVHFRYKLEGVDKDW